jgi:RimJ/RimL family protein N-acetyltransferase
MELRTARLLLRPFRDDDLDALAAINADPEVTRTVPAADRAETARMLERIRAHWDANGFGLWAVDTDGKCAGWVGLARPRFEAPFLPAVEIGWRLAPRFWGLGYASEGARAALAFGFETVALDEIVSFTVEFNARSRAVMERIGMRRDAAGDFEHPSLPPGHPMRPHVLYRLKRADWLRR